MRHSHPRRERERRLRMIVVAVGLVGTALIIAVLGFSRAQTDTYRDGLLAIDVGLSQPVRLLNETQEAFRQTQDGVEAASESGSPATAAALYATALNQSSEAKRTWMQFKEVPPRFEGEDAARAIVDDAILADDDAGQRLGVVVLSATPDPTTLTSLREEQRDAYERLREGIEHIKSDLYFPQLGTETADLEARARQMSDFMGLLLVLVAACGVVLTALGYRQATRVEARVARERIAQRLVEDDNALDSRLQTALEMAATDDQAFRVISRAIALNGDDATDFLLADSDISTFHHAITPEEGSATCPVRSASECPVARHGQLVITTDSTRLDTCANILDREVVPGSAVCVPVSIAGHTVGVIHESYAAPDSIPSHRAHELEIIARQAGERIGMLRAFARSEAQAHTDPLTGLLNRRSLDEAVDHLTEDGVDYCVAYADLDHFKVLNDTYGHDMGDRALRLFCSVLRTNVRPDDIVSRYGGEEFVVVLPRCAPEEAVPVMQRVQRGLADTVGADGVPPFTVSIGIASNHNGGSFDETVILADGSLRTAKAQGRNRIVVSGSSDEVLGPEPLASAS